MKVYSSLKKASDDLFIKDVLKLGKTIKKDVYLKALKELTSKTTVSSEHYKPNVKTVSMRKGKEKNTLIVYELNNYKIHLFNGLKDLSYYQLDKEFLKACEAIIKKYEGDFKNEHWKNECEV